MTHQTPAPTAAEVERLARKMCEIAGEDPDDNVMVLVVDGYSIDGPAWKGRAPGATTYLLALAAHRALMLEDMAQADAPFLEEHGQ
jgi:hypothetical protein